MIRITLADLRNLDEYEKVRDQFRKEIIELKKRRRVGIGEKVSLVFENRETVLFQIQEMIRAERIVTNEKIQDEVDVYNSLLPGPRELSATLMIEIQDRSKIKEDLDRFFGIDEGDRVWFDLGRHHRVVGVFEAGHSREDKISAVHFVRFAFDPVQIAGFATEEVALVVDHPNYRARATLDPATRASLLADLRT